MFRRFLVSLALVTFLSGVSVYAQSVYAQDDAAPPPPPSATATISVKTSIVAVTALARDKTGELIRNLDKKDFTLKEDGKVQDLRYFDKDNDLPLQIGLMIDTSGSQKKYFDEQGRASKTFLHSMLSRPEDQAFVVRFDNNVLLLQKLTDDQAKLQNALGLLSKSFPLQKPGDAQRGTRLYDAICATAQQVIGKERGRRAVIVMTDGEDNGSYATLEQAMQQAQKADTAVYTILYSDRADGPGLMVNTQTQQALKGITPISGRVAMQRISLASGGRLFVVDKNMTAEKIFQQIELDMRMQYRLGYKPPPSTPGKYHDVEVKSNVKGLQVQARVGYYTPE